MQGPGVHGRFFEDLAGTPSAPPIGDVGGGETTSTECGSQTRPDSEGSSEVDETDNGCPLPATEGFDGCNADWKAYSPGTTQNFERFSGFQWTALT